MYVCMYVCMYVYVYTCIEKLFFYISAELLFLADISVRFAFNFVDAVLLHLLIEHERLHLVLVYVCSTGFSNSKKTLLRIFFKY